jgi:hypothetical protein
MIEHRGRGGGIGKGKVPDTYERRIHKRKDAMIIRITNTENLGFVKPRFTAITPPIVLKIISNAPNRDRDVTPWGPFIISA